MKKREGQASAAKKTSVSRSGGKYHQVSRLTIPKGRKGGFLKLKGEQPNGFPEGKKRALAKCIGGKGGKELEGGESQHRPHVTRKPGERKSINFPQLTKKRERKKKGGRLIIEGKKKQARLLILPKATKAGGKEAISLFRKRKGRGKGGITTKASRKTQTFRFSKRSQKGKRWSDIAQGKKRKKKEASIGA